MTSRRFRWALGVVVAAAVLVAIRVTLAFVATPPRADAPVAMHGGDVYGDPLPEGAVARLGTIRFRGKGPAVWAPDGEHLLVGGWNDTILAMNATTGLVDWTLPGHSTPFTRNVDDLESLWRAVRRGSLEPEEDVLSGLTLFPDGKRLLSQGYSLRVWDLQSRTQTMLVPLRGGNAWGAAISPDGRLAAWPWSESVRIVDLVAGKERRTRHVGSEKVDVNCVAWSGDGARVFAGLEDGRVAVVSMERETPVYFPVSDCAVDAVLVADEGRALWTLDHKGALTIRSLASPDVAPRRIDLGADDDPKNRRWRGTLTASPDGRVVASTNGFGEVRWIDVATGEFAASPKLDVGSFPVGWSSNGRRFVVWSADSLRVVGEDMPVQPDTVAGRLGDAVWSPDGRFVATASYFRWDKSSICAWDAATGRRLWTFEGDPWWWQAGVAWSADGAEVVASFAQRVVGLDAATGVRRWTYEIPAKKAAWPSMSPRGEGAMWVDEARDLHVVDLRGGPHEVGVAHLGTKPATDRPHAALLPDLSGAVLLEHVPIEVHADGSWTGKLRVRVWRVGASAPAVEVDAVGSNVLAVTRDGRFAAAGDGTVVVLDLAVAPPSEVGRVQVPPPRRAREWASFMAAAFSADGSMLALGDDLGTVHVYAMPSLAETKTFRGHRAQITSLAFSPDGARLVSGSVDATALVWRLR